MSPLRHRAPSGVILVSKDSFAFKVDYLVVNGILHIFKKKKVRCCSFKGLLDIDMDMMEKLSTKLLMERKVLSHLYLILVNKFMLCL